jgi:non-specific serine/threonine protein kinase
MLELIREYALDQLAARGESLGARRRHAAYFLRFAEEAGAALRGPQQQLWRDALEDDLDNLRAVLDWTVGDQARPQNGDTGLLMVGALWYFWFQRGLVDEGRYWLARALARAPSSGRARAEALLGAGTLAWRQGDCAAARAFLDESVGLWRGDDGHHGRAETLHVLGHVRFDQRDYAAARDLFEQSLDRYRRGGDTVGGLPLLGDLGLVAYHEGDYAAAGEAFRESLALYRQYGLKDRVAGALNGLGDLALLAGQQEHATALYAESLALWRELRGNPGIASALHKLGQVARSTGDTRRARALYAESLTLQRDLGNKQGIGECLAGLAGAAAETGQPERAARILAASAALLQTIGVPLAPVDQAALTRDMDTVRDRLGAVAWNAAWTAGSALSTDEAITLALTDDVAGEATVSTVPTAESRPDQTSAPGTDLLSRREHEVCQLIAQGLTNREISASLSISEKTVGSHIDHIMTKLGLRSRTRIAVWAVEHGLGPSRSE